MGTPTAITDALLSGNVDVVGIGLPGFLTMWDKTRGSMNVRGIVAMNRQPAYLNTRNPNIKSIRDFTETTASRCRRRKCRCRRSCCR